MFIPRKQTVKLFSLISDMFMITPMIIMLMRSVQASAAAEAMLPARHQNEKKCGFALLLQMDCADKQSYTHQHINTQD